MNKTKKIQIVELYRFLAACGILWYHSLMITSDKYPFWGGYIYVEFFFILTGFLSFKHIEEHRAECAGMEMKCSVEYTVKKLLKVLPYSTVGILLSCLTRTLQYHSFMDIVKMLLYLPSQVLLLPMSGVVPGNISDYVPGMSMVWGPFWFLSAILLVLPVLLYVCLKHRGFFWHYLAPIGSILAYGWVVQKYGSLITWSDHNGMFFSGVLRAVAGMLLGGFAYSVSKWIGRKCPDDRGSVGLAVIEVGCFAAAAVLACEAQVKYDICIVTLFFLCLAISMSGRSATNRIRGGICAYLGKAAMPLYCIHSNMYSIVGKVFPQTTYYQKLALVFVLSFLAASVLMFIFEKMRLAQRLERALFH